jgi:hypothetical protein
VRIEEELHASQPSQNPSGSGVSKSCATSHAPACSPARRAELDVPAPILSKVQPSLATRKARSCSFAPWAVRLQRLRFRPVCSRAKVAQPHPNQQGLASRADDSAETQLPPRSATAKCCWGQSLAPGRSHQLDSSIFFAAKPYCVEVFSLGFFVGIRR